MRIESSGFKALEQLGLTKLEARAYVVLLSGGPATAYGVAKGIDRPAPNTYRIIEALVAKGLVVVEDGNKRLFGALPYEQMLAALERRFRQSRDTAESALAKLQTTSSHERVYRLNSRQQVFEHCRALLERAEQLVLVDAFPDPLAELSGDIARVAARGVEVKVKCYRPTAIEGALVIADYRGESALETWNGQWLNVVADAREHVLALLDSDGVNLHQAIWTGSSYLSWIYHCGIESEMTLDRVVKAAGTRNGLAAVRRVLEEYRPESETQLKGRRRLVRRQGA